MLLDEVVVALAKQLNEASIPYMIVGGQAAIFYGETRFTKDIDVTLLQLPDQYQNVLDQLTAFEPMISDTSVFVHKTWVMPLRHKQTGVQVDIIFSGTQFEQDAVAHGIIKNINGVAINFISPEYLIVQKVMAGRSKDLDDIEKIINVQNKRLDIGRIEGLIKQLDSELGQNDFFQRWKSIIKT